jgi:hypothetical protein
LKKLQLIDKSYVLIRNIKTKKMKISTVLITTAASLFFASCITNFTKVVEGNGNVISNERTAENFSGIKVSSGIDVYLSQGDTPAIRVDADDNLQDYIITEVRDDVLHIYTEVNIRGAERKRVYVTAPEINLAETSSAGDIIGETPVSTDAIRLSASSAGNIRMEIHAKEISAEISSSGDIILTGDADILEADISSAGNLKAYDLKVREADVSTSSAGDAEINVSEKLRARASSAGDINYTGDVQVIDANSSSAGDVNRR